MHLLYYELISETWRAERLKEARKERLASQVKRQVIRKVFYQGWAYMLGVSLVQWGQSLKHFGTPRQSCSLTSVSHPR